MATVRDGADLDTGIEVEGADVVFEVSKQFESPLHFPPRPEKIITPTPDEALGLELNNALDIALGNILDELGLGEEVIGFQGLNKFLDNPFDFLVRTGKSGNGNQHYLLKKQDLKILDGFNLSVRVNNPTEFLCDASIEMDLECQVGVNERNKGILKRTITIKFDGNNRARFELSRNAELAGITSRQAVNKNFFGATVGAVYHSQPRDFRADRES